MQGKLPCSKKQMCYFVIFIIIQVIINVVHIHDLLNPYVDFTWSSVGKFDDAICCFFFIIPIVDVLFGLFYFKKKWIGLKSILITCPFIIICYFVMAPELLSVHYNLFPLLICLVNILIGVIITAVANIISRVVVGVRQGLLMKIIKKFCIVIIGIIIGFVVLHITPSLAIRTHLMTTGYPGAPFVVNVKLNKGQTNQDKVLLKKENSKIYYIEGNIKSDIGTDIFNFKVKKIGFLYFAEYYGEA